MLPTSWLSVLLVVFCFFSYTSCQKCDGSTGDNECYNLEEWRNNIICRLQGGTGNTTVGGAAAIRQNGYTAWALNQQSGDSSNVRRTRYNAMRFFIDAEHELQISYRNLKPRDRRRMLERFERGINDWGTRLAAVDTSETWTGTAQCGLTGVTGFTLNIPCGQKTNEPACPIRPPPGVPGIPGR